MPPLFRINGKITILVKYFVKVVFIHGVQSARNSYVLQKITLSEIFNVFKFFYFMKIIYNKILTRNSRFLLFLRLFDCSMFDCYNVFTMYNFLIGYNASITNF